MKDNERCTDFLEAGKIEPEVVLVSETGRFLRFSAGDIPEKKRGAGTVAGIAMKDGEQVSDVFFIWPNDIHYGENNKQAPNSNEEPAKEEQQQTEVILTLRNKKQIPFSKLAKAKRGGKGTLKKI